jgi:hypothetical protein
MTKKKEIKPLNTKTTDIIGLLLALIYMQSVLTVAHHTSMWGYSESSYTVGPPAIPALVIGLLIVTYTTYRNKMKFSTLNIITLTIFTTASLFWLSGLRANF